MGVVSAACRTHLNLGIGMQLAAVAGMEHGHGFCIRQVRHRVWSAPLYLRLDRLSLGVQLTSVRVTTAIFLAKEEAVRKLCKDGLSASAEFSLPGRHLVEAGSGSAGAPMLASGDVLSAYAVTHGGTLVDISIGAGMVTTDGSAIHQYHGLGTTVADILSGNPAKAPHPVLFQPLYDYIDKHISGLLPAGASS